jgi:hypothetical protein
MGIDIADESRAVPPVLLAITVWLTWTVSSAPDDTERLSANRAARISMVSPHRLMAIGSRLEVKTGQTAAHQLVRLNVYNFGDESVTLCALALRNLDRETLACELAPALVVRPGARHPLLAEVTAGPVAEGVELEVEHSAGGRQWVSAQLLPRP